MSTFDNTSPAQGHQALSDIDQIRNNLVALRDLETSLDAVPPSNPVAGQRWRTSDTKKYYMRNQANTQWIYLWSETDLPAKSSDLTNHVTANITNTVAVHGVMQGSGNGFDADKLDGLHSGSFALGTHNHTGEYLANVTVQYLRYGVNNKDGNFYLGRANHTGYMPIANLSGHDKAVHDALGIIPGDGTVVQEKLAYVPGSVMIIGAITEKNITATSYTKYKEIRVVRNGSVNVVFSLYSNGTFITYGRIYVNGSPVGQERFYGGNGWYPFPNEVISVSPGDLVQFYGKVAGGSPGKVNGFALKNAYYITEAVTLD